MGLRTARLWRVLILLLCASVALLFSVKAFCASKYQEIHGSWVIDLEATKKESLAVYFGKSEDYIAEASSAVFTFDTKKMQFRRYVLGKEKVYHMMPGNKGKEWILWLQHVKFPDYIIVLPDGRLRYGSDWGINWEFVLRRSDTKR